MRRTMKLWLLIALLVSVALVRAQEEDIDEVDIEVSNGDGVNGGYDESDDGDTEIPAEPLEEPDEEIDEDDGDENENENEDEDEDEDEIRPTTSYWPNRKRRPGCKCMIKARKCFMNATECEDYLACYEEKSACWNSSKKGEKPFMKKPPSKMICKSTFKKCMEGAGSDCFKKYMCYRKKSYCYRSRRRRGHRKPFGHRFRPHRRPTMNPEMWKCKMQWKTCYIEAKNCNDRLQCLYDIHECMNRSRPTGPPPTMSPEEGDVYNMNVYKRRWNPKLKAKCKKQFDECIENTTTCPMKMKCFWDMKMCFKPHKRPHHGYKNKMMWLKITTIGGYGNRGLGSQFRETRKQWGNRGMGSRYGQTGRQWGNRGMESRYGQTGRQWGNRGMGSRYGQTGRQWGNRGMGSRYGQTGRQWGNRGMESRYGQTGRKWGNRGMESRYGQTGRGSGMRKKMERRFGKTGREVANQFYKYRNQFG